MKECSQRVKGTAWESVLHEPESKEAKDWFKESERVYRDIEVRHYGYSDRDPDGNDAA